MKVYIIINVSNKQQRKQRDTKLYTNNANEEILTNLYQQQKQINNKKLIMFELPTDAGTDDYENTEIIVQNLAERIARLRGEDPEYYDLFMTDWAELESIIGDRESHTEEEDDEEPPPLYTPRLPFIDELLNTIILAL